MSRTIPNATSASHATDDTQIFHRVFEFVHQALTAAFRLGVPWVVPGGVLGELTQAASIPAAHPLSMVLCAFVLNVEAGAGGAGKGAGTTTEATHRGLFPLYAGVCILDFVLDFVH